MFLEIIFEALLKIMVCAIFVIAYTILTSLVYMSMPRKLRNELEVNLFIILSSFLLADGIWVVTLPERYCKFSGALAVLIIALLLIATFYLNLWFFIPRFIKKFRGPLNNKGVKVLKKHLYIAVGTFLITVLTAYGTLEIEMCQIDSRAVHAQQRTTIAVSYETANVDNTSMAMETTNHVKKVVDENSDLAADREITVDQMNTLIRHWCRYKSDSKMLNTGDAFIKASERTGLDPVFLMAIAGHESAWGSSKLHTDKNNPYSICMYDYNVHAGLHMGDSFSEGIIAGAEWINKNYYSEGQTSLYSMIYGQKCYAQAKDTWINSILQIMNRSYDLLEYNT